MDKTKNGGRWQLGTWFIGRLGSVRLMFGLGELKGVFQPKLSCDVVYRTILTILLHYLITITITNQKERTATTLVVSV